MIIEILSSRAPFFILHQWVCIILCQEVQYLIPFTLRAHISKSTYPPRIKQYLPSLLSLFGWECPMVVCLHSRCQSFIWFDKRDTPTAFHPTTHCVLWSRWLAIKKSQLSPSNMSLSRSLYKKTELIDSVARWSQMHFTVEICDLLNKIDIQLNTYSFKSLISRRSDILRVHP